MSVNADDDRVAAVRRRAPRQRARGDRRPAHVAGGRAQPDVDADAGLAGARGDGDGPLVARESCGPPRRAGPRSARRLASASREHAEDLDGGRVVEDDPVVLVVDDHAVLERVEDRALQRGRGAARPRSRAGRRLFRLSQAAVPNAPTSPPSTAAIKIVTIATGG